MVCAGLSLYEVGELEQMYGRACGLLVVMSVRNVHAGYLWHRGLGSVWEVCPKELGGELKARFRTILYSEKVFPLTKLDSFTLVT